MIDVTELLKKINIVEYISQYVILNQKNREFWGLCPFHKEDTPSFSINEEKQSFYCFGCHLGGNLLYFVQKFHNKKFSEAIDILCNFGNLDKENIPERPSILRYIVSENNKEIYHEILPTNIMDEYSNEIVQEWVNEQIKVDILTKYMVKYNKVTNSIVFPIFDNSGNIINICSRTLFEDYKERGIPKYKYLYKLGGLDFFYGYSQHKNYISKQNEIIIFEGAKSVLKAEGYGILNTVASLTNTLSPQQTLFLSKINVDNIVFAWDSEVEYNSIKNKFKTLSRIKHIFIFPDVLAFLDKKDSPIDKGYDIWYKLYKNKKELII